MADKGKITSVMLWREDFERIETLRRSIEARVPGTVRVSTNSIIRAALASAVAAMPAGRAGQDEPRFTIAIEPVDTPGRPGARMSVRRKQKPKTSQKAENPAAVALPFFQLDDVEAPPPAPAKPKRKRGTAA
jgi:hypothetical protein